MYLQPMKGFGAVELQTGNVGGVPLMRLKWGYLPQRLNVPS